MQRRVSSQILQSAGYQPNSVDSGHAAIEFFGEHPQDILVLDMIMPPGMDGTETYQRVLEINPHQKAIIVCGYSESDRVLMAQKMGAGAFVKKPLTKGELAAAVRAELDSKSPSKPG